MTPSSSLWEPQALTQSTDIYADKIPMHTQKRNSLKFDTTLIVYAMVHTISNYIHSHIYSLLLL